MKNNEATIFMFIASVIIGILISLNINFKREPGKYFLSANQYQDAINTKNDLLKDISGLKEQYTDLNQKITGYIYGGKSESAKYQQINAELKKNQLITGTSDVEGPGIEIFLDDGSIGQNMNPMNPIIHYYDMANIINDLKTAGAEAISVNGQRIISTSYVECSGDYLLINGVQIAAPFYIDAIGNKEVLQTYMTSPDSYMIRFLDPSRSIHNEITQMDSVKITAYHDVLKTSHLKEKK
ncbi:MAG: DUF881 domain-containing protein [Bacillota bacterium]|nr:DUF881 domain-containing protein [Bacillota bacterium]